MDLDPYDMVQKWAEEALMDCWEVQQDKMPA